MDATINMGTDLTGDGVRNMILCRYRWTVSESAMTTSAIKNLLGKIAGETCRNSLKFSMRTLPWPYDSGVGSETKLQVFVYVFGH